MQMKLKKLNIEICGYDLYVEENAPIEKIRAWFKKEYKYKKNEGYENVFFDQLFPSFKK